MLLQGRFQFWLGEQAKGRAFAVRRGSKARAGCASGARSRRSRRCARECRRAPARGERAEGVVREGEERRATRRARPTRSARHGARARARASERAGAREWARTVRGVLLQVGEASVRGAARGGARTRWGYAARSSTRCSAAWQQLHSYQRVHERLRVLLPPQSCLSHCRRRHRRSPQRARRRRMYAARAQRLTRVPPRRPSLPLLCYPAIGARTTTLASKRLRAPNPPATIACWSTDQRMRRPPEPAPPQR